jgi:hypothetical protein
MGHKGRWGRWAPKECRASPESTASRECKAFKDRRGRKDRKVRQEFLEYQVRFVQKSFKFVQSNLVRLQFIFKKGRDGVNGKDGRDGVEGNDGKNGKDGQTGLTGKMKKPVEKQERKRFN